MRRRGITFTDDDILRLVRNIYAVLLTRGMLGTYVYVCDKALRERLRTFFSGNTLSARGYPDPLRHEPNLDVPRL